MANDGYVRDAKELAIMQSYPLDLKISLSRNRIFEWVNQFGEENCVVSFSGGKDSTVLLHLVRTYFPDIKAVFSNTGLEFPEIQRFVRSFDNVDIVTPKMRFDEVISTYGYPLISKEVAEAIYYARRIHSQDVNAEREREREAASAENFTAPEQQEVVGQKDSRFAEIPHGMKQANWKRLEIVGGEQEAYQDEQLRDAEDATQRTVPSKFVRRRTELAGTLSFDETANRLQRQMGTEVSRRSRGSTEFADWRRGCL